MTQKTIPGDLRRDFSRRSFLKKAVTAAVPLVLPATAVGAGRTAPSDKVTLGFLGMGKQNRSHLGNFLGNDRVRVVAICDAWTGRVDNAAKRIKSKYGGSKGLLVTKEFRSILDRKDIDAAVIATPDHWHALMSIHAARAGKDIYCEKPMTHTLHEAREVVNAVRRYGRVFQTGSQQRSSNAFRTACELVQNGRIGKLHTVNVNVGGPSIECYLPAKPTPDGLDWDRWLGPAPYRGYHPEVCPGLDFNGYPHWRRYRDYGGGGVADWGAHHFDIAQWGMGTDDTGPVEIIPPRNGENLKMKYAGGVVVYHGGGDGGAGVTFRGTKGKVMTNRYWCRTDPEDIKEEAIRPDELHLYKSNDHHANWLDCLRTRGKTICHEEIGCRSVSVCHLVNICYQLDRPLKWNPDKEVFIGDDDANRLKYPVMREPWRL